MESAISLQRMSKGKFLKAWLEFAGGEVLLCEVGKGGEIGKMLARLRLVKATTAIPKAKRKGHPYVFRLTIRDDDSWAGGWRDTEYVIAAPSLEHMEAWLAEVDRCRADLEAKSRVKAEQQKQKLMRYESEDQAQEPEPELEIVELPSTKAKSKWMRANTAVRFESVLNSTVDAPDKDGLLQRVVVVKTGSIRITAEDAAKSSDSGSSDARSPMYGYDTIGIAFTVRPTPQNVL